MSWDNSRPKPGRPSSPDSTRNALYDQLLSRLRQGPEPPATPEGHRRWFNAWQQAHPAESPPFLDGRVPWPVQLRQALDILTAMNTPEEWSRFRLVAHEDAAEGECCGCGEWPCAITADLGAGHEMWRRALIARYRLEGFVPAR